MEDLVELEIEQPRIVLSLTVPPTVKVRARGDLGSDALVVEVVQHVVFDEQVSALAGPESTHLVKNAFVLGEERVVGVPLPFDQGMVNEELASFIAIDPAVVDLSAADEGNPVQRNPFDGRSRTLFPVPHRLVVAALYQVVARPLRPLGLDTGRTVRPQAIGFDQFAGHDPVGWLLAQRRPSTDHEPGVASAHELIRRLVLQADLGEQPGEDGLMDDVALGRFGVDSPAERIDGPLHLTHDVLPLADPVEVEKLSPTHLAELVARAGFALGL